MTTLIHVLGADIPHHNLTLLRFFDEVLATTAGDAPRRRFMVVARDATPFAGLTHLSIEVWPDKRALARALVACAQHLVDGSMPDPYVWGNRVARWLPAGSADDSTPDHPEWRRDAPPVPAPGDACDRIDDTSNRRHLHTDLRPTHATTLAVPAVPRSITPATTKD